MKAHEARIGVRVAVSGLHRIEQRRGMVGTVVGCYGGPEYTAVDVCFPDGVCRLFWPGDLEEQPEEPSSLRQPRWQRFFLLRKKRKT